MTERFIQSAIKHPGSLKKFAKEHKLMTHEGHIDLPRAKRFVERNEKGEARTHRLRQINLAFTLRRARA